ncbi:MAG: transposase [Desulfovibrio sp.]|nr:transposase [Desulfovibrio sp.]
MPDSMPNGGRKAKKKFALEFMPPYSPELNPIERVWKFTRRKGTHNRYFPSLKETIAAAEEVFAPWQHGSDVLRKLCAIN